MASATWDESVYNTPYFLIVYGTPYFFAMIFLELIYSIRTEKKLYRLSTGFTSFATGLIMSSLEKGIHGLAFIVPYSFVYHYCRIATLDHLVHPALLHFFAFLAHDLLYYVGHRFLHETNIGWAAHAPHHSSEDYNLMISLRQGVVQPLYLTAFYLVLAVIGLSPYMVSLHYQISLIYQFGVHTELIGKLHPWIEFVFNTPSQHRVHHARNPKYLDKNYAGILSIWDRLFGTLVEEDEQVVYGLTTPLTSFNPWYMQTHHWVHIYSTCKKYSSPSKWFSAIFRGPGYNVEKGEYTDSPELPTPLPPKYDRKLPLDITLYTVIHYLFAFAMSIIHVDEAHVMSTYPDQSMFIFFWQFVFLYVTFATTGSLFDLNSRIYVVLEIMRCALVSLAVFSSVGSSFEHFYLFPNLMYTNSNPLLKIYGGVCSLSCLYLLSWFLHKNGYKTLKANEILLEQKKSN